MGLNCVIFVEEQDNDEDIQIGLVLLEYYPPAFILDAPASLGQHVWLALERSDRHPSTCNDLPKMVAARQGK